MSDPTEPVRPTPPQGGPQQPAPQPSPSPPQQPAPAPAQPPYAQQPGAAGPGAGGVPPHAAYPAGQAPVGPPPKRPGLWSQATSTTGGTIAVALSAVLVAILLLTMLGTGALLAARAFDRHNEGDVVRIDQERRVPQGPDRPKEDRPRANGQGQGLGQLLRGMRGLGNVQHGEFSVTGPTGEAVTMTVQRGAVTTASATSVAVKSADGFTATYAVNADTRFLGGTATPLKVGNQVIVLARKQGSVAVLIRPAA